MTVLDGEALPQVGDKLRAIHVPSALRCVKDSKIGNLVDFGQVAGTFATIVAGTCKAGKDKGSALLCFLCGIAESTMTC